MPLSEYRIRTRTNITIIRKHVRVPLGTADINAYFQETGLPGYLALETSDFGVSTVLT